MGTSENPSAPRAHLPVWLRDVALLGIGLVLLSSVLGGFLSIPAQGQARVLVERAPGGEVVVSWSADATGFGLEESPVLGSTARWTTWGAAPVLEGTRFVVRISPGNAPRFFRLSDAAASVTRVVGTSPAQGEERVAVTRETIVRFSRALAPDVVLTPTQFNAAFGGRRLLGRVQLSADRRSATLFYLEPIPGGARIRVTLEGAGLRDVQGREVDVDGDGLAGGTLQLDYGTLGLTVLEGTAVTGRVFASELEGEGVALSVPLAGVTITVDGREETLRTVTDAFGNFRLSPVPPGDFFVHIDGRTALRTPEHNYPEGAYYPVVGKRWIAVPGEETAVGNVYLPLIAAGSLRPVSAVAPTLVTFPASVLARYPELDGVTIEVPANALVSDDGRRGGMVGIAPVEPDRLPSPLPRGLEFPLVITVQTDGAGNFDAPVPVCFPNLPDPITGVVKAPGTPSALWSFNHDLGDWEIVGPMTVSADGRLVCSDPGFGLLQPGWHGESDGSTASGGDEVSGGESDGDEEPENGGPGDASDPVYLFSGEFHLAVEDLRIPGRGIDFVWVRKYRSKIGPSTALGHGWDYSYNVQIEADDDAMVVRNGQTRAERYLRRADGTYAKRGRFRQLTHEADGRHRLTFEDSGGWEFRPLDGSPSAGKLARISDRNGNQLLFDYDATGRLAKVTDTLGRDILIAYDAAGRLVRVTDFAGRRIEYGHYDGIEAGGGAGDLKSVTTPPVTGTPNGNNFPAGKTTTYTYSTGFADDRLNHNLLTITDGRRNDPGDATHGSGPYLVNVYAPATDPGDPDFDRVTRQVLGGGVLDYVYVRQLPSLANAETVTKTIVNDRNGQVKEYFYDRRNRMVRMREYTGRARADEPTTESSNRPVGRLRASDPEYFETRYEWNEDSLQTRVILPNGTITEYVYESDLNPGAPARSRGNLRILRQLPGAHELRGDQAMTEERYEYDPRFGGASHMTRLVDALGQVTVSSYDARGNRVRQWQRVASAVEDYEYNAFGQLIARVRPDNGNGHRRRDEYAYHESGSQRGYLREWIVDSTGERLVTRYEYDAVGNLVALTDPRGNETRYVVNAQNQVVREISPEVRPGTGIRYQRDQVYDANNNLVRVDFENRDHAGVLQANSQISIHYEYDVLNFPVRVIEEVDAGRNVIEEYVYDANRNRVLTRYGEAISGAQPGNVRQTSFDERDLEYRVIHAPGHPLQSSTQYDYDATGNLVAVHAGLEGTPRTLRMTYDAYNRPVRITDPLGNVQHLAYDAADRRVRTWFEGELVDGPGAAGNVVLNDVRFQYDALGRLVRTESKFFDSETGAPIGGGTVPAEIGYSDASEIVRLVDGRGNIESRSFDTAGRLRRVTDPAGNTVQFAYDANGNIVGVTETELPDGGGAPEVFLTSYEYDGLDRRILERDSSGNVRTFGYDSLGRLVREEDAQRTGPGAPGNVTRYEYDGLGRLIATSMNLTGDGTGSGAPVGGILLRQTWDDSNRLVAQTDPAGNVTRYEYDPLNREVGVTYGDGTVRRITYDVHGNPVASIDPNGSTRRIVFDALNRPVRVDVEPGPGVAGTTTFEQFRFDGLSRVVQAENDRSVITRAYDSFSRVRRETQNGRTVTTGFDALGNLVTAIYPGGRTITTTYDALNRKKLIQDAAGVLATYEYAGPGRTRRRTYGNGTETVFEHDGRQGVANPVGDYGVRRIVRTTHARTAGGEVIDHRTYTWDRMHNKSSRTAGAGAAARAQRFDYDSIRRLIRSTATEAGGPSETIAYSLDAAGNRLTVAGGADPGTYTKSAVVPDPADASVNQYTTDPKGARRYDSNGNLTRLLDGQPGQREIRYDDRNRMVEHLDRSTGTRTFFAYDAIGRRISKTVGEGAAARETRFYYVGWRECEEQDAAGATLATYVHGNALDEVLSMRRGGEDFFYHADDLLNVVAVTDRSGEVVERYEYEDYGLTHISAPDGFPRVGSVIGNPYQFAGRRWDAETGFYDFRTRYLEVRTGRFTTRDTIGIWGDPIELGNGYTYVGNNPWTSIDPLGQGLFQYLMGNNWDDPDSELWEAAGEGAQGGASILANTMSFGGTDKIGLTNSEQYQGREYDASRFAAMVSREALLAAITGGAAAARGGACALQGMGKLAPLIELIQATKHGPKIASLMHKILEAINTGRDAADLVRELYKLTEGNGSLFDAILSGLGVLSGIDGLRSLPGFCLAAETEVSTPEGPRDIASLGVGDRVHTSDESEVPADLERLQWEGRWIGLRMGALDGGPGLAIELLRDQRWMEETGCDVGRFIDLRVPEKGIRGLARVEWKRPSPELRTGPGRLVTGVLRSEATALLDLGFEESPTQRLRLTEGHPVYSENAGDWVAARDLIPGVRLRTRAGSVVVSQIERHVGRFTVYNLEVETAHCYFVSAAEVLSHNSKPCPVKIDSKQLQKKFKHAGDFGVPGNYNSANARKFQDAVEAHVMGPGTQALPGTYRGEKVTHYLDPSTGLNVIQDAAGNFLSGWKLSPQQLHHVTTSGNLGGG